MKPRRLHSETITSSFMDSPRPRLANDAARAESGPGERVGPTALRTRVQARPVTQRLERAHAEAERDARRRDRPLQGAQAPDQQRIERHVPVALGRQARHPLDDPRRLPEPLEVSTHPAERAHDVEVVDPDQLAPVRVEEDQLAEGEELEGAGEPRPEPARGLGDAADLAEVA